MLVRITLATVLGATALALSGCAFGSFHRGVASPSDWTATIHQQNSAETIYRCQAANPDDLGRANCALDVIRFACNGEPFGWPVADCNRATDHTGTGFCRGNSGEAQNCSTSMKTAFRNVRDGVGGVKCLAFEYEVGGPSRTWFGASPGWPGCP